MMSKKKKRTRRILVIIGVSAWIPVIVMRHALNMELTFLEVLPFLLLHVSCMLTLLTMRIIDWRKRAKAPSASP